MVFRFRPSLCFKPAVVDAQGETTARRRRCSSRFCRYVKDVCSSSGVLEGAVAALMKPRYKVLPKV